MLSRFVIWTWEFSTSLYMYLVHAMYLPESTSPPPPFFTCFFYKSSLAEAGGVYN